MTQADTHDHTPQHTGRHAELPRGMASRREAAQILGIHVISVDRMIKRGEIKAVRYCGRTMIPIVELERLTTEGSTPARDKVLSHDEAWQADRLTD